MAKIIGNTTATPMARPDWEQTDETKAGFIKNKPIVDQVYSAKSTNAQSGVAVAEIIASINKIIEDETRARTDADSGFNDRIISLESNFGDGEGTVESQIEVGVNGVRDELNGYKEINDAAVKANTYAIGILNGNTSVEGSVDKKIAFAINDFATKVSDDKTINTYKELIDYAASHGSEFTELVGEVDANTKAIEALNGDTSTIGSVNNKLEGKVDKVNGKGLSTNDYTTEEKNKLSNIEDGAQVNIQPDWNQTDETKDGYIKNKPTLGTASEINVEELVGKQILDGGEIFNDYENNKALGPFTQASGYNTTAGVTGYYFVRLELDSTNTIGTFYISDTQYGEELSQKDALALSKDFAFNYTVGDTISYVSGAKYLDIGTITDIDTVNKIVTVTANTAGKLVKGVFDTGVDDQIFYVREKPEDGIIPFGHYATAEGEGTFAAERGSHAEGRQTIARGQYGHAEGRQTIADYAAHAEGRVTKALGNSSHTEGMDTIAYDTAAHAEGRNTQAIGQCAHAEGSQNIAKGGNSHAEGNINQAIGLASHAEGSQNIAEGSTSHAEGDINQAIGFASHAEGQSNEAIGNGSHVEGNGNKSIGTYSHAEGNGNISEGVASHAEGSNTKATGAYSHAEGSYTNATGSTSHVEGQSCLAAGKGSHAEGIFAKAHGEAQHVQGRYNIEDYNNKYAHIVGNGTSVTGEDGKEIRTLSNAHTLDWEGNAWFAGDVVAGDVSLVEARETAEKSLQYWKPNTLYKEGQVVYYRDSSDPDAIYECLTTHTSSEHLSVYGQNGLIVWRSLGEVEAYHATIANRARLAENDMNGNDITDTYATKWELTRKADKATIITDTESTSYTFDFSDMYNSEMRLQAASTISIIFVDNEYAEDYISGLSFNSGETPTGFDYTDSGIINWVGTDCATSDGLSIFQPSANTHYDIVFYFNGTQFIGLVNGFVPASGNEAV